VINEYEFGLIEKEEAEGICGVLQQLSEGFGLINIVEIGLWDGLTANAICNFLINIGQEYMFYGIDNIKHELPEGLDEKITSIIMDANNLKVVSFLPTEFHFVIVDACHCKKCAINQFNLYSPRIVKGGIIAFHDTSQDAQGDIVSVGCQSATIEVLEALKELKLEDNGFTLIREELPIRRHGIRFYQKL